MTFDKKKKAIEVFVSLFGGSFKKLDKNDVDYKVFDKDGVLIAYAEVKVRIRTIYNAYPLPVASRKLVKLVDKRIAPVVIWACEDGIIYGKANKIKGEIKYAQDNSFNDLELMVYYDKQKELKYIRYS